METRKAPRVDIDLEIVSRVQFDSKQHFVFTKGQRIRVKGANISTLGVKVLCDYFLPTGLVVRLSIEGRPLGSERDLEAQAQVRHCQVCKNMQYSCGLQFSQIADSDRELIKEFIKKYSKGETSSVNLSR